MGMGVAHNFFSSKIMSVINNAAISTHFISRSSLRSQTISKLVILPVRLTVIGIITENMSKSMGVDHKTHLQHPVIEFTSISKRHIPEEMILALNMLDIDTLERMKAIALRAYSLAQGYLLSGQIELCEMHLTFGHPPFQNDHITMAGDLSFARCSINNKIKGIELDRYERYKMREYYDVLQQLGVVAPKSSTDNIYSILGPHHK